MLKMTDADLVLVLEGLQDFLFFKSFSPVVSYREWHGDNAPLEGI